MHVIASDVLCFSHLRWNFVYQRPNHLMSRRSSKSRVWFIEEPLPTASESSLSVEAIARSLWRVVPRLNPEWGEAARGRWLKQALRELCDAHGIDRPVQWFYTPSMLEWATDLPRSLVVYDCMDELSNFLHAPPQLREWEKQLMAQANLVFTGGMALYEAKRHKHHNVHGVPSSVDVPFFARARHVSAEPEDQAKIPKPRLGYCGVIDERIDLPLLDQMARAHPHWQVVMLGPVVKIDPNTLPRHPNIHYLGPKKYEDLPSYLGGWDVALMPFALNDATRYISPTKTPEYLAAGRPVISTAITDVVEPYERLGLVRIGRHGEEFMAQVEAALDGEPEHVVRARERFLKGLSWDATWARMEALLAKTWRDLHGEASASL